MTQSTDFIEQLAALAEIERDLAAKFQTDRVVLGEWIDAMGAVNGYICENVPAILALGRERDALVAENNRLASFLAGVANCSTYTPPGAHGEAHKSKLLREVRNGARLVLNTAPKGFSYEEVIADRRRTGPDNRKDGSAGQSNPPRRQGLSRAKI